jgi:hypothetical protein
VTIVTLLLGMYTQGFALQHSSSPSSRKILVSLPALLQPHVLLHYTLHYDETAEQNMVSSRHNFITANDTLLFCSWIQEYDTDIMR